MLIIINIHVLSDNRPVVFMNEILRSFIFCFFKSRLGHPRRSKLPAQTLSSAKPIRKRGRYALRPLDGALCPDDCLYGMNVITVSFIATTNCAVPCMQNNNKNTQINHHSSKHC